MKKSIMLFAIIMVALPASMVAQQTEYKPGELLVKFDPVIDVQQVLSETLFTDLNMNIKRHFPHLGVWYVTFEAPAISDQVVLSSVRGDPRVIAAQFNHHIQTRSITPNDDLFGLQWNMNNTGQTGGTAGADVSAPAAWGITTGNNGQTSSGDDIVLAIIDDGFDLDHEDMNFTTTMYDVDQESEDPEDMTEGEPQAPRPAICLTVWLAIPII